MMPLYAGTMFVRGADDVCISPRSDGGPPGPSRGPHVRSGVVRSRRSLRLGHLSERSGIHVWAGAI